MVLLSIACATASAAQEPPAGDGPRGSSQAAAGEQRYDVVGYAGKASLSGVAAAAADPAAGDYAEVTVLDTGRTVLVRIVDAAVPPGRIVALSRAAADALGTSGDRVAVRVRRVSPPPQDVAELLAGRDAGARADAPEVLLRPLRRRLPMAAIAARVPPPSARRAPPRPVADPVPGRYLVQVVALSSADRARAIAESLGGSAVFAGGLYRVQIGPLPSVQAADEAIRRAVRAGFRDARRIRATAP